MGDAVRCCGGGSLLLHHVSSASDPDAGAAGGERRMPSFMGHVNWNEFSTGMHVFCRIG